MQSPNHILAQEGILASFSIAKKVTIKDIKQLRTRLNKNSISQLELNNLVKQTVINETQVAIEKQTVPGLIAAETMVSNFEEKKRLMELTYFASIVAKKLTEKKSNKYHLCFVVNALVNMLSLREEDFDEFHRKFSEFQEGESDNE
jgi:predicted nucleic acid-binding protein